VELLGHDLLGAAEPAIERDEIVGLLVSVSDIAVGVETLVRLRRRRWGRRQLTKAERVELDAFLQRMHANALRTRELAERAQAKLDAERSDR